MNLTQRNLVLSREIKEGSIDDEDGSTGPLGKRISIHTKEIEFVCRYIFLLRGHLHLHRLSLTAVSFHLPNVGDQTNVLGHGLTLPSFRRRLVH